MANCSFIVTPIISSGSISIGPRHTFVGSPCDNHIFFRITIRSLRIGIWLPSNNTSWYRFTINLFIPSDTTFYCRIIAIKSSGNTTCISCTIKSSCRKTVFNNYSIPWFSNNTTGTRRPDYFYICITIPYSTFSKNATNTTHLLYATYSTRHIYIFNQTLQSICSQITGNNTRTRRTISNNFRIFKAHITTWTIHYPKETGVPRTDLTM